MPLIPLIPKNSGAVPAIKGTSLKRRFRLFGKLRKRFRIVHRKFGENLSVQVDVRRGKPVHKLAVRKTVQSRRRVDTYDPQFSEISLSSSSADVGIVQRLHHRFAGDTIRFAFISEIAFRKLENFSTLFNGVYSSFNTHVLLSLLVLVRHHVLHRLFLRGGNEGRLTKISSSLAALGFGFVVLAAVRSVDLTAARQPETLFGTAMGFLFRHITCPPNYNFLIYCVAAVRMNAAAEHK